jgi:predicted nucleic acid-binding protein
MAFFLDSNVVLYGLGNEPDKKTVALALLAKNPYISTQVINECSHVLRRRLRWQPDKVAQELSVILDLVVLADVALEHIRLAWKIAARYGFSHYDSLIVASALAAKCDIFWLSV